MTITSFTYLIFLAVVLTCYYLIKPSWQTGYLVLASLVFYCLSAKPLTLVYLVISTVSVYYGAIAIHKAAETHKDKRAKCILVLTLILNFGLWAVAPSLGISYYTLQLTGYLLDCYWKVGIVQTDFVRFALFGCYFPQLTSGPVSRYKQIQQNLYEPHFFSYEKVTHGLRRMAWGLFKKMVVADRLGLIVNSVYANYEDYNVLLIWGGIFCFSLQLYTDFSGCMDIVLGTSECLGITLPENFRNPFFSVSTQEFWQRWHITLGTWLKDYIMDPVLKSDTWVKLGEHSRKRLGKKWGKRIPTYLGMLILWLAMGLWHGTGLKFIVGEGLWFWLVIILGNMCGKSLQKLVKKLHINPKNIFWITFQRLRTFLIFSLGLICFRAENLKQVFAILKAGVTQFSARGFSQVRGDLGYVNLIMLCVAFVIFAAVELVQNRGIDVFDRISQSKTVLRWLGYLIICGMIVLSLSISGQSFIYAGF